MRLASSPLFNSTLALKSSQTTSNWNCCIKDFPFLQKEKYLKALFRVVDDSLYYWQAFATTKPTLVNLDQQIPVIEILWKATELWTEKVEEGRVD